MGPHSLHRTNAASAARTGANSKHHVNTNVHPRPQLSCRTNAQQNLAGSAQPLSPFQAKTVQATSAASSQPLAAAPVADLGYPAHKWSWKGHSINYVTAGCGKPVLLVHGFGASSGHYRKTIPWLAQNGFKVYAIDLVGFGASDKPVTQYTIELWAELIDDFLVEFTPGTPAVVVGNSIGSLSCLAAAALAADRQQQLAGLVLLNSAGAMNNKGVVSDWRIIMAWPLLMLIDALLRTPPIARALFNNLAQPGTIRKVLGGVYVDQSAVDDELVDIILKPAFTPNALDVFVSVITGPAGPKPWDLVPKITCPMLIAWGDTDPFTPLDGPVGQYFSKLSDTRPGTDFALLEGVGHCPQDDHPEQLHERLLPWLKERWSTAQ